MSKQNKQEIKAKKTKSDSGAKSTQHQEDVDYKDKYLRSLADYQNLLKRTEKEKREAILFANEVLVEKLLPVLDHIERAEGQVEDEGVLLIYKELTRVLNDIGVQTIEVKESESFNPEYMECVEVEEGGKKLRVTRSGYIYKDKVIRPVQVRVIK